MNAQFNDLHDADRSLEQITTHPNFEELTAAEVEKLQTALDLTKGDIDWIEAILSDGVRLTAKEVVQLWIRDPMVFSPEDLAPSHSLEDSFALQFVAVAELREAVARYSAMLEAAELYGITAWGEDDVNLEMEEPAARAARGEKLLTALAKIMWEHQGVGEETRYPAGTVPSEWGAVVMRKLCNGVVVALENVPDVLGYLPEVDNNGLCVLDSEAVSLEICWDEAAEENEAVA